MIRGSNSSIETNKIILKSVTTIGSPILLFNMMLGITTDQIKIFTDQYKEKPLRWLNIIHSSDIIAYPLRSSLNIDRSWNISLEDKYIQTDANAAEKAVRKFAKFADKIVGKFSEFSETIRAAIDHAPMVVGVGDAHTWYWKCNKTASLITDNILDSKILDLNPIINQVITRIEQVDGMTENLIKEGYLSSLDDTLAELKFKDGSGTLLLQENPLKIHHVYLFDANNDCQFAGYVGWIHRNSLKKEVKSIKKDFC